MSYVELVKGLRENAERCDYDGWIDTAIWFEKAADAIEELQAQIDGWIEQERKALLKSVPKWIPVTERLPEDEKDVLVYYGFVHDDVITERRFIGVLEYFAFDAIPHWQNESTGLTVTHWMPLPEPPKEETE